MAGTETKTLATRLKSSGVAPSRAKRGTTGMVRMHSLEHRMLQHISEKMDMSQSGIANALVVDAYDELVEAGDLRAIDAAVLAPLRKIVEK